MISIDDLEKLDIRIRTILSVENVEGSEKLYNEIADFGQDLGTRQILSGVKNYFAPVPN